MRITRLVSGLVTTGLVVTAPLVVTAAPAEAATISSTVTVETRSARTEIEYGDDLYISGDGQGRRRQHAQQPPPPVCAGCQRRRPTPTWTVVATDDSAYFWFSGREAPLQRHPTRSPSPVARRASAAPPTR